MERGSRHRRFPDSRAGFDRVVRLLAARTGGLGTEAESPLSSAVTDFSDALGLRRPRAFCFFSPLGSTRSQVSGFEFIRVNGPTPLPSDKIRAKYGSSWPSSR